MSARLALVEPQPQPFATAFPVWARGWWRWTERGLTAWGHEVGTVALWGLALLVLAVVAPIALVGQACCGLVRGR